MKWRKWHPLIPKKIKNLTKQRHPRRPTKAWKGDGDPRRSAVACVPRTTQRLLAASPAVGSPDRQVLSASLTSDRSSGCRLGRHTESHGNGADGNLANGLAPVAGVCTQFATVTYTAGRKNTL